MLNKIMTGLALLSFAGSAGAQAPGATAGNAKLKPRASAHHAHPPRHHHATKVETQAELQKEAKISEAAARATAMKEVPNGVIKSAELEREHGKLIYSFDITVAGKSGIDEVNVNAMDGSVVARQHEGPKAEKKEARQEAKEAKTRK